MFTPLSDAFSSKMASARAALQLVSTPQLVEAISRRLLPQVAGCCCGLYMYLRRRRLVRQLALEQAATTTTATAVRPKGPTFDFCTTLSLRLRSLENRDFSNYFLQLLGELTTVGELPRSWCEARLGMFDRDELHELVVLEDLGNAQMCGAATLVVESKFIHECGMVGHLEDVVVHAGLRGKGLGKVQCSGSGSTVTVTVTVHSTALYTTLHHTTLYCSTAHHTTLHYSTLHCTAQYSTPQYSTQQHSNTAHSTPVFTTRPRCWWTT